MLTVLDVVNAQLATMGEAPILEADLTTYPMALVGQQRLRQYSRRFQSRGWWFNTVKFTAEPDPVTGVLLLPCGILRVEGPGYTGLSIRGSTLYDHTNGETLTSVVEGCQAVVELDFADLPPLPQQHVFDAAVLSFQQDYDSTERRTTELKETARGTFIDCVAEHTRALRANRLLNTSTLGKIAAIRQGSGRRGLAVR